jgi:transcriptional regulator NrdR family protein
MAQSKKQFRCPECGTVGPATYSHLEKGQGTAELRRRYRCDACSRLFTTTESPVRRAPTLSELMVRGLRGSENDRNRSFNREKLPDRLEQLTPKTLTEADFAAVVAGVEDRLTAELDHTTLRSGPVRVYPSGHPHGGRPYIDVATVDEFILRVLRSLGRRPGTGIESERFRSAHVKFALGLVDYKAAHEAWKWEGAADVIRWINEQYPSEAVALPQTPEIGRPVDPWWPPAHLPSIGIEQVIKNFRPEDLLQHQADVVVASQESGAGVGAGPEGGSRAGVHRRIRPRSREPFEPDKLRGKVDAALRGRPTRRAERQALLSWVVWGLAGQKLVRTSQLSAAIADGLRGLDDIAYLRWVAIGKELNMREILDEALSLLVLPSPRLVLEPIASAPVRSLSRPGPGSS